MKPILLSIIIGFLAQSCQIAPNSIATSKQPTQPSDISCLIEHGAAFGDPHFIGGDGGRFDFHGQGRKIYNLLDDSGFWLNARFKKFSKGRTYINRSFFMLQGSLGTSRVDFSSRGEVKIQGDTGDQSRGPASASREWQLEGMGGDMTTIRLTKGLSKHEILERVLVLDHELYSKSDHSLLGLLQIETSEGYYIEQLAVRRGKAHRRLDIGVATGEQGYINGRLPSGLIGQTFDLHDETPFSKGGEVTEASLAEAFGLHAPEDRIPRENLSYSYDFSCSHRQSQETGQGFGDPHFIGGDQDQFDFHGMDQGIYNLLDDHGWWLNARFEHTPEGKAYMTHTRLMMTDLPEETYFDFTSSGDALAYAAGSASQLSENGLWQQSSLSGHSFTSQLWKGGRRKLLKKMSVLNRRRDRGRSSRLLSLLTTTTPEGYYVELLAVRRGKIQRIDVGIKTGNHGYDNGQLPSGLIGQTFDRDEKKVTGSDLVDSSFQVQSLSDRLIAP